MYLGEIVEVASRNALYREPQHPYTRALLSAAPIANPTIEAQREHILLQGEVPSPLNSPSGCHFHPRCKEAKLECASEKPVMQEIASGHFVACHLD